MHIKPFFYESVWFMILCALVGIFLIYATVRYRIRQIREKELEVLVEKRTAELKQLNRELDQRVFDRTAELAASNQELEAFSYSVSHDLRAPVRRIEGLIQAVIEDFASQMNQAGKDFLEKIRESTGEMNQLIEEFLKLARIARQELDKTELDMSRLAAEVTDDLARTDPGRKVMVNIHPGLKAMGDTRLIRIVLQNLLGNAWKYTGKNPSAEIEFACRKDHHQAIFFIRDNGVGFDMNHYDKLFAPFMRLHSDDQFTGTGIGLATVKRIIVKHGGKIWAQSEPGKGSTFYFTF
jgi:light-regulated signal transduction histidine kinase (bacteriophytochrome)